MTRKDYDRLVTDMANGYLNHELLAGHFAVNAINNILIAEGIEIPEPEPRPVSEQEWEAGEYLQLTEFEGWRIYGEDDKDGNQPWIAIVRTKQMRDILCGIPGLVKACLEQGIIYNSIADALETMGLIDSDGKAK